MNTKHLAIFWVIGIIGAWIIIGLAIVAITGGLGGSELGGADLIVSTLTSPTVIMYSIVAGTIFTPCCYCYAEDAA